jgi:hypothetical protein
MRRKWRKVISMKLLFSSLIRLHKNNGMKWLLFTYDATSKQRALFGKEIDVPLLGAFHFDSGAARARAQFRLDSASTTFNLHHPLYLALHISPKSPHELQPAGNQQDCRGWWTLSWALSRFMSATSKACAIWTRDTSLSIRLCDREGCGVLNLDWM